MITNKHIDKIVSVIVAIAVVCCFSLMDFSGGLTERAGGKGIRMEYETKLFDPASPLTVNISMSEDDWRDMLGNASAEDYRKCDVEVGGQTFREVGIRPKGNTSLSAIASNPDTDRFSFKLEFDRFVEGQTCFGLDKLVLNNNYADATNMKEALIYDMYRYIGTDAALCNYAAVCVNGEYWGVYLALEAVEDSFLLRNYGAGSGRLYKPDSMDMGDKDKNPPAMPGKDAFPEGGKRDFDARKGFGGENFDGLDGKEAFGKRPDFGGFPMGGNGANLNYIDDDPDSYTAIWDGEVTKSSGADHKRVVKALKNIAVGRDLEKYMDIDNLLRYMAVHVFAVNNDSLTGTMAHNYYLYEENGRLNMIPWDYNLALGGMGGGGNASDTINDAIDGAFSGTRFFDALMADEDYCAQYHACLQQLVDGYINGGAFDEFYTRTREALDGLVETDPTAFYSAQEYFDAAETLYQVVKLRGQSIAGQLDGTIPSTASARRQDGSGLVDTGDLDLSVMGTMDMGNGAMGGGGGFKGFRGGKGPAPDGRPDFGGGNFDGSDLEKPERGDMEFDRADFDGGNFAKPEGGEMDFDRPDFGGFPGAGANPDTSAIRAKNLITYGVSLGVLMGALVFAMRFKRKSRRI